MKKVLLLFTLAFSFALAQTPGPKWVTILDLEDQKVFVDTSTIKEFQNQISVLSITFFKAPQQIDGLSGLASSVKSQVLFNLGLQKYSTVGTLYYDNKLKILGESSLPGFAGNSEAFSVPIDSNQVVANIYAYCLKYINRGERSITDKEFSAQSEQTRKTLDKLIPKQNSQPITPATKNETAPDKKSVSKIESAVVDSNRNKNEFKTVEKDTTVKVLGSLAKKREEALKTLSTKQTDEKKIIKENGLNETIFEEGGKYSFQVSSWKSKSKAERELSKLKAQGHNAFIVEAFVNKQRGTWYRVRIGYFNTFQETEAYQKKLK